MSMPSAIVKGAQMCDLWCVLSRSNIPDQNKMITILHLINIAKITITACGPVPFT
jgi:hypothetical protein